MQADKTPASGQASPPLNHPEETACRLIHPRSAGSGDCDQARLAITDHAMVRSRRVVLAQPEDPLGCRPRHRGAKRECLVARGHRLVRSVQVLEVREAGSRGGPQILRFTPAGFGEQPEQHHDQCWRHEGDQPGGPHRHCGTGAPMPLRSAGAAAGQSPAMVTWAGCSTVNLWRIVAVCPPSSEISQVSSPRSFCSAGFGLVSRSRTLISPSVDTGTWS